MRSEVVVQEEARVDTVTVAPRLGHALRDALADVMARDDGLLLLGEDVEDPYGGAFRITAGLSTQFPGRVLNMPISEAAIAAAAGGAALTGDGVIAELMFADFATLAFDTILNGWSKSASMYGEPVPPRVVLRLPYGAGRGYGATHSQAPQKHFLGIHGVHVHELTPFHDPTVLLETLLAAGVPALLFEHKLLYPRRPGVPDDFDVELDDPVGPALVRPSGARCGVHLVCPGGSAPAALLAARSLREGHGVATDVTVPQRLHPLPVVGDDWSPRDVVVVTDEGTPGGSWSDLVALELHRRGFSRVGVVNAAAEAVPAGRHLEADHLPSPEKIVRAVLEVTDE